jgi:hypothetical protein
MNHDQQDEDRNYPLLRAWSAIWMRYRNIAVPAGSNWERQVSKAVEAEARAYGGGTPFHWAFVDADKALQAEYERQNGHGPEALAAIEARRHNAGLDQHRREAQACTDQRHREAQARSADARSNARPPDHIEHQAYGDASGRGRSR